MNQPINQAAALIASAQSVIIDLMTQASEIQLAINRQQNLMDSLIPVAIWDEDLSTGEIIPEPTEDPVIKE
jgi:hypothetical protein